MNHRPIFVLLAALLAAATLWPDAAHARFIMADAHFDNRTAGASLPRGGALQGEPVTGPYDREREEIVVQGAGDLGVYLGDTQIIGPSEMYWAMRDGLTTGGGLLTARVEISELELGDYTIALRTSDQLTDVAALDIIENGTFNEFYWRDADDPTGDWSGFAVPGLVYEVRFEVDLNAGTYSIFLNDDDIVVDEPHGLAGAEIAQLVIGHLDDGNATGSFEFDLISLDWRGDDTTPLLLDATFADKPVGEDIQLRGAFYGEPVSFSGQQLPYVEVGMPLGNKALVIEDDVAGATNSARFEFYNGAEPASQPVSISFAASFDVVDGYNVYVREQGSSAKRFCDMQFTSSGGIQFKDEASSTAVFATAGPYAADELVVVEMAFESGLNVYSIWVDGKRVVHRRAHGITDRDVGRVIFGNRNDADLDGVFRVDRIRCRTLGQPVAAPELAAVDGARLLGASPNPFNPATELRFTLPRAGHVRLDIFDSRGRHVRRLVDGHLGAGEHRPRWQGRDETGRNLASGVYHARLIADRVVHTRALTLLK
jgi:hypothetical protein